MLRLYGATGLTPQALLSWALAKSFQIQELPEIGRTEHNKPYFPTLPGLHVNWSHSGPFVLCALGNAPGGGRHRGHPPPHRFPPPLRTDGLRVCPVSGRRRRLARFLRPLDVQRSLVQIHRPGPAAPVGRGHPDRRAVSPLLPRPHLAGRPVRRGSTAHRHRMEGGSTMKLSKLFYDRTPARSPRTFWENILSGSKTASPWSSASRRRRLTLAPWIRPATPTITAAPPGPKRCLPRRGRPTSISSTACITVSTSSLSRRGRPARSCCAGGAARAGIGSNGPNRYGRSLDELTPYQRKNFLNGPGKLCKALSLTKAQNGISLLGDALYLCDRLEDVGLVTPPEDTLPFDILSGPRVGIDYAEEAAAFPWRYQIKP